MSCCSIYNEFCCIDCDVCTSCLGEYYMVNDETWGQTGLKEHDGMLCIGCLEKRIGRQLQPADFPDYPINSVALRVRWPSALYKSSRLINRIKSNEQREAAGS